jgi:hypothetical protein
MQPEVPQRDGTRTDGASPRRLGSGRPEECFVVMPFGKKPAPGTSHQLFDFDKIYRVVMRRAIEAAGMVPVRADESTASGIIHADMFKALRDKPVVLAELSLLNPNVYYELGIRHVLSSTGTVLMCRQDQPLPFDVALSRVVLYEYDGLHLDWEEAERIIPVLRQYLLEAQQGRPDSPVHALIHIPTAEARTGPEATVANPFVLPELHPYAKDLGRRWRQDGLDLPSLMENHARSIFGARSIGYYCLAGDSLPDEAAQVAAHLVDTAQYDLANELFERFEPGGLNYRERVMYASSYSETHPNEAGAVHGIALLDDVITDVQHRFVTDDAERAAALADCLRRRAGLLQWRWQLTNESRDLEAAIDELERALAQMLETRRLASDAPAGLIAQIRVKLMLHLRIRDGDAQRPDVEQHGRAVLTMPLDARIDDENSHSWVRWYQVIVLADQGNERTAREKTFDSLREDARLNDLKHWDVGRRQYVLLRRFIDQYSEWFREPTLIGTVAQALQSRLDL